MTDSEMEAAPANSVIDNHHSVQSNGGSEEGSPKQPFIIGIGDILFQIHAVLYTNPH